jgi:hypothetical protein
LCDAILEGLAQHLQDVACALGPFIQKEHAVVRQRHVFGHRHLSAADQPHVRNGVVRARKGRVVTNAVRLPVRPATRWMRVVSMASGMVISGGMVVSRRVSIVVKIPRHRYWQRRTPCDASVDPALANRGSSRLPTLPQSF